MVTCGMMFFSTESWNKGGGGKSIAKKRKGDTNVLDSKDGIRLLMVVGVFDLSIHTAIDVKLCSFIPGI